MSISISTGERTSSCIERCTRYDGGRILPALQDAFGLDLEWRGFSSRGQTIQRVAIFIDHQNVYKGARQAFCPGTASHIDGQIHPRRLALKLKGNDPERKLQAVRVYRGLPSSEHDRRGYAAADRQVALWRQQALVEVITRPLNYRDRNNPKEKGIDVRIAIDFVMMAMKDEYDVGVLFSGDTDLLPALEVVAQMEPPKKIEVACWQPPLTSSTRSRVHRLTFDSRLQLPQPWCHYLDDRDYGHVHDETDYTQRRRRR